MNFDEYAIKKPFDKVMPESWANLFLNIHNFLKNQGILKPKILDYGCGDGRIYSFILNQGLDKNLVYGCEVSKIRLRRCKNLGWKKVKLIRGNKLKYKKDFFHIINMMEVIEHIEGDSITTIMENIRTIMHPKGILLITTPNYPIKRFYDFWAAIFFKQPKRFFDDPTHCELYNKNKLKKLLEYYFESVEEKDFKSGFLYKYLKFSFFKHKLCYLCRK
jgi:2-polyprenyl-3-methyl-5-hydroxy-6-metoxy-1,4-benzoquinol methylase